MEPRVRFTGRQREVVAVNVDYADVLAQAVANERWRVSREVRAQIERIATTKDSYGSDWRKDDRTADDFKKDALRVLDSVEVVSS